MQAIYLSDAVREITFRLTASDLVTALCAVDYWRDRIRHIEGDKEWFGVVRVELPGSTFRLQLWEAGAALVPEAKLTAPESRLLTLTEAALLTIWRADLDGLTLPEAAKAYLPHVHVPGRKKTRRALMLRRLVYRAKSLLKKT